MASALARLIIVPMAFLIAAVVSGFVLVTLGLERITNFLHSRSAANDPLDTFFDLFTQAHLLVSGLTVLPALLLIVVGEVARIRSAVYYVVGGGGALAAIPLLAHFGQLGPSLVPDATVWQVFATAGFAGGFVYWLLAGRRA
jgi:hypothetical protein